MADDDLRALVETLTYADAADFADIIANFSTDMLQKTNTVIDHHHQQQQQQQQQQQYHHPEQQRPYNGALLVNRTLETQCLKQQQQQIAELTIISNTTGHVGNTNANVSCLSSFDSVLCWPRTPAGTWSVLPCFEEFKGVHYDTTENATRYCHANGSWSNYSDYAKCDQTGALPIIPDFATSIELPAIIYSIGYLVSFAALVVALIIFLSFKDLKCLRNTIHANLFVTYITTALVWLLTLFLQVMSSQTNKAGCITLVILYQYFSLTNFFWMFVEALYLYTLVVQTFSSENISVLTYALIGWGLPAIIIVTWSVAKVFALPLESENFNGLEIGCPFMHESHIDWVTKGPSALIILLNLIFLIRIMWVLIMKLRSAHTLETRQYYKASKALLVLIPLFGITYLLVITGPEHGISRNLFEAVRAFLLSTQGFFVSLFFCFLNSEVRQALRHRLARWQDNRNIHRDNSVKNRRYRFSKDYSQRSRTESLRTEECVICVRPTQHFCRSSLRRCPSVERTDFV